MLADPLLLARVQFGLNIGFHILFPTVSIGLGWVLFYLRLRWSRGEAWVPHAYRLWIKIFALTFALGVVSGITMSFQFGTNWPGFMQTAGNIAGPLLGYEVLTAFFLEATFLGVMLFGKDRVPAWMHTLSSFLVAFGTTLSAFWILALNSWMHTPQGYEIIDGQFHAKDWIEIIFGISAFQLLRNRTWEPAQRLMKKLVVVAAVLTPVQIFVGDMHGLNTLEHQPAKIAAIEGIWHTERGAPLLLFAVPNKAEQRNDFAIGVPKGAALILRHDVDGELQGLSEFDGRHPPVAPLFFGFRLMVGIGMLMLALAWLGVWRIVCKREWPRWQLRAYAAMTFSGWIATLAGWIVTEVGRQPYVIQGLLTTADAASKVPAGSIGLTLAAYAVVYVLLIVSFMVVVTQLAIKEAAGEKLPASVAEELAESPA
jgi:cytochrome bd ubiquinol oxidase subunit I